MRRVRAGNYAYATEVSRGTFCNCGREESRTKQSFAKDADINELVRRFGVTGLASKHPVPLEATLQVFENVFDFQSAMNAVVSAEREFQSLDSKLRKRFDNDPHEFVQFCSDPKNSDELVRLGLAIARPMKDTIPKPSGDGKSGDGDGSSNAGEGKGSGRAKAKEPDNSSAGK